MRTEKVIVLSLVVLAAVALAGCAGPPQFSEPAERARMSLALDAWVDGVERYDVEAMAGDSVLAPHFTLVMTEAGYTYTKNRDRLRAELEEDREWQEAFRGEGGYAMRLDIDGPARIPGDLAYARDGVDAWTVSFQGSTKSSASGFFEVFEKSTRTPDWWPSDRGSIDIQLEKTGSGWRMSEMHIRFGPSSYGLAPSSAAADAAAVAAGFADEFAGSRGAGFGIGRAKR